MQYVNLVFSVTSFINLLILCIFYFPKKRLRTFENNIYSMLVAVTISNLIVEILSYIALINGLNYESLAYIIIMKITLMLYLTWTILFLTYITSISLKIKNFNDRHILKVYYFLYFILIILIIVGPMTILTIDNLHIPSGFCTLLVYAVAAVATLLDIYFVFKNGIKGLDKKYIPIPFIIFFAATAAAIQMNYPQIFLLTPVLAYTTFIMYFTIENPDMKMVEELNIAKQQAEKSNRAKTDFLSSMSHEIRTPLNAIVGFNECITEAKTLEEAKENAKDVITAANTLLETINGILDISKIESGKLEVINVRYKPKKLFEDSVKLLESRIMDKNLEFNVKIAEDLPYKLMGDQANLKKCVINLLTNAVKYTDRGSITFHVNCVNEDNNCKMIISVEDTGRGIKPENIEKLFTKFQRLDEDKNSTIEGTGLGLAITKQLIELMGGKIVVQSVYGSGSKFTIYIAQEIVQMLPSVENEIFSEVEPNALTFNNNKKVLIVDDNMLNLKVASKLLEKYNLNIDTAESGSECIDKVKSIKYDLILMDDMMPKMTGTETLHILKQDSNFDIPVIALTANALVGEREKYLKEGFLEYLSKPIDRVELEKCLKHFLIDNKKRPISFDDTEAYTLDFTKER